ncbi:MAG: transposase [Phycisphaerae bacterium]
MGTTVRQIRRSVQKIAKLARLDSVEAKLARDCVVGISKAGSCKVSDIARTLPGRSDLRKLARPFYDGLADERPGLDELRPAWLRLVAPTADKMPFIAVDPSDITKMHARCFDYLDYVRDASDKEKRKGPGFPTIQIEATDRGHVNLPLWQEVFSTEHPDYRGWYETIGRAIVNVLAHTGKNATWLFDRGCDAGDFYPILRGLGITWVVRQLQTRKVIFGDGQTAIMRDLAASIDKPHETAITYVDKKTHEPRAWPVRFGYAPVRLPDLPGRHWMIVVTGLRDEDMVLLTNKDIRSAKHAAAIVLAYMRRWGIEEGIRCWKQKTGVEDFRVRNWTSIRRLTFFSMLAYGIQALWLLTRPATARRLIARVKVFIEHVLFRHYRLWDGVRDALLKGA